MKIPIIGLFIGMIIYLILLNYVAENFNDSGQIELLATAYNSGNAVVKNLKVTGTLYTDGKTRIGNDLVVDNVLTTRYGSVNEWFNKIPKGIIVEWTGNDAPAGWAICDGTNRTPDLRGRFIIGKGQGTDLSNYNLNDRGGVEQVTLTIDQMPIHSHGIGGAIKSNMTGSSYHDNVYRSRGGYNSDNTGGSKAHENRPPYYALAYIMKI